MSVEDFRINASVRQILCRCWVDLKSLRYGAAGGIVYFHGRFEKITAPRVSQGHDGLAYQPERVAENLALLETVEKEVRRDPNVTDVVFRLENFKKIRGKWIPAGA